MFARICLLVWLWILPGISGLTSQAQSKADRCFTDSVLFSENPRWHLPGETLMWADSTLLDSLLGSDLDGFKVVVQSPRSPGRYNWVVFTTSPEGREALFSPSDLRFISYDPLNKTNHSQSTLVGHTYYTTPYWYDEELHFQNGRSNWIKHAQRLYHSSATFQMEIKQTSPVPLGVESALVLALDDASYFICLSGSLEDQTAPIPIYSLAHESQDWVLEGNLNPDITQLESTISPMLLEHFVVLPSTSSYLVVDKDDLNYTVVPSKTLEKVALETRTLGWERSGLWRGKRGDTIVLKTEDGILEEDIAKLVEDADWKPLIVPAPKNTAALFKQGNPEFWGWSVAIALGGISLFLMFTLIWTLRSPGPEPAAIVLPEGEAQAPLSPMVITLLAQRGRMLNADQFDAIVGLGAVVSPETRRSRRARIIQVANAETNARFGHPLVQRTKSDTDKRVVLYRIQDFSTLM